MGDKIRFPGKTPPPPTTPPTGSTTSDGRHPAIVAADLAAGAAEALLKEVASGLRYADFQAELPIRSYRRYVRVALADLWGRGEIPDIDLIRDLRIDANQLKEIRESDTFKRLCEQVVAEFQEIAAVRTYREHIERPKFQDQLFRKRRTLALFEDPDIAEKAGKTLEEKILPKENPKHEQRIIMISSEDILRLRDTSLLMRQLEAGDPGGGEPAEDLEGLPGRRETPG